MVAAPLLGVQAVAARPHGNPARDQRVWKLLAVAPQSRKMPELETHYRQGVEWGLAQVEGLRVDLHWIGAHAIPSTAARTIEAALHDHPDLDGVLGWIPPELERRMIALTQSRDLPVWVSDTGADFMPSQRDMPQQAQGRNSLALCDHADALARKVVQREGRRAVLAVGWMESGYDFVNAFQRAYREAGGQIVARHIGGPVPQAKEFGGLRRTIFEHRPDALVAFYSGPQATRFTQWWQANAYAQGPWELATLPWFNELNGKSSDNALSARSVTAAFDQWRAMLEQANLPRSAASLLGSQAGRSVGASLLGLPADATPKAIAQAWSLASESITRDVSLRTNSRSSDEAHQPLSSGWLNGYLQT